MKASATPSILAATAVLVIAGCGGGDGRSDAYGNFEATEVLVSAESAGRLLRMDAREGDLLQVGREVALVDTLQLTLSRDQLRAQRSAVTARLSGVSAQLAVLEEQRRVVGKDRDRVEALAADGAATQKQMDDVEGQVLVLDRQIEAARTQYDPIRAEAAVLDAHLSMVEDQIRRCHVVNPVAGTVLATYAEASELTAPGKPLYAVARLDTLELRAWVSGALLPHVRIGQSVTVLVDEDAGSDRPLEGRITWIASAAEFTPKLIQTKEERVSLVYAFKIRVANPDGRLKIGMPGEVRFGEPAP